MELWLTKWQVAYKGIKDVEGKVKEIVGLSQDLGQKHQTFITNIMKLSLQIQVLKQFHSNLQLSQDNHKALTQSDEREIELTVMQV